MWQCKGCTVAVASRHDLLNHYKLNHPHFGRTARYPCTSSECPCTFKTWNALIVHQSRVHSAQISHTQKDLSTFSCHICDCKDLSNEREFFLHINTHLKRNEIVSCVFIGCSFQTCIYGTFKSHKSRRHTPHTLTDFIPGIVTTTLVLPLLDSAADYQEECVEDEVPVEAIDGKGQYEVPPGVAQQQLAAALLKLEYLAHVAGTHIDDFLQELYYLLSTASVPESKRLVNEIFERHSLEVDDTVITEIVSALCSSTPVPRAIEKSGPLSTSYHRKQYYKRELKVVEPITYILNRKKNHTFQYVPLLKSLQQILNCKVVVDKVVENHRGQQDIEPDSSFELRSSQDALYFKENNFLNSEELRISLRLYVDDFETCNPLGTSRKKHKLCGVYWVLGNLPPGSHSSLSSIFLAILCKSVDVKRYGYEKVLEPLLQDLKILENDGVYIALLGKTLRGTVQCVIADNLGARSIAGLTESFSGDYFCRFCIGKGCDIRSNCVASGAFNLRTRETYVAHTKAALENDAHCFGVKSECVLTKTLSHFCIVTGFPPDVAHDVLEGIVPVELARCLSLMISKKLFTLDELNKAILSFPYKWSDKTNKPHVVQKNQLGRKTIGGNAHENWALIRFLPFLIGAQVPEDEPAWLLLMDLKDIVELVVAPVHTDESISYLEIKIVDHRQRYVELFPDVRLLPKQHFLEHYPHLIRCFGPLVQLWTMRFESKHSFFKQIVKHTSCYKNVPLTLASKHQFMIAFHINSPSYGKPSLDVTHVSTVPVDVLREEVVESVRSNYPNVSEVCLARNASRDGITYSKGMVVAYGSVSGLPEFAEIIQMCVVNGELFLMVKLLCGWYRDHYRAFELSSSPSREFKLVALDELTDNYPLADYMIGSSRMVTLKRHIIIKGQLIPKRNLLILYEIFWI